MLVKYLEKKCFKCVLGIVDQWISVVYGLFNWFSKRLALIWKKIIAVELKLLMHPMATDGLLEYAQLCKTLRIIDSLYEEITYWFSRQGDITG